MKCQKETSVIQKPNRRKALQLEISLLHIFPMLGSAPLGLSLSPACSFAGRRFACRRMRAAGDSVSTQATKEQPG